MNAPELNQMAGGGYTIRTTQLDGGKWLASVALPGVDSVEAPREVEAIRLMTQKLDRYVGQGVGRLA